MKKINRKVFENLIRLSRKYYATNDIDTLFKRSNCYRKLEEETRVDWIVFADLSSAFAHLKTTDKKIEEVMNLLGFELVGEENE